MGSLMISARAFLGAMIEISLIPRSQLDKFGARVRPGFPHILVSHMTQSVSHEFHEDGCGFGVSADTSHLNKWPGVTTMCTFVQDGNLVSVARWGASPKKWSSARGH